MKILLGALLSTSLLFTLQAEAQGRVRNWLRTIYPRITATSQVQELATMEINRSAAQALTKLRVVAGGMTNSSERWGGELPALDQVRIMLHEQDALLLALHGASLYEINKPLRKLSRLAADDSVIVMKDNDGGIGSAYHYSLAGATALYVDHVHELVGEEIIVLAGSRDPLGLINLDKQLAQYGSDAGSLLQRADKRRKAGRRDVARALRELSRVHSAKPVAYVHTLAKAARFAVRIEALATPLLPHEEEMALPGVEAKARIFELAARLAAANSDDKGVLTNLQRILALSNDIDLVTMSVSLQGEKVVLNTENINSIGQLYLQVFTANSPRR